MRQLKLLTLAMMMSVSLSIVATSAAQAVELKFLPEGAKYKFKSNSETALLKLNGKEVKCKSVEGSGELLTATEGTAEFKFKECSGFLGVKCTGLSDTTTGQITAKTKIDLRHLLSPNEAFVHIVVLIPEAETVHFSCSIVLVRVLGCVASDDLLTDKKENVVNLLLELFLVNFLQTNGDANITSIDTANSLNMISCILLASEGSEPFESSGQSGSGVVEGCEAAGKRCSFLIDLSGTL